ncbi:hypothetical protein AB8R34_13085, partial [Klebsiella pneumoniae]
MDNGSGETVQDAQRGQNRQAEPGGEYFVYFWNSSTGQVRMPQIYDMGLTGDYPVRFNNEQTA